MLCFVAAGVAAVLRLSSPFEHGWWLVSYLALVGGVAQLLLGPSRARLVSRLRRDEPVRAWLRCELLMWNAGVVLVPAGVLTELTGVVRAGSAVLLVALTLYATGLQRSARSAPPRRRIWEGAYYALVALLTGSVVIGTALADALPWQ